MLLLKIKPEIHEYTKFNEFVNDFKITDRDLILSADYIMKPLLDTCDCDATIIDQEKFGKGEPSDLMVNDLIKEVSQYDYDRLIAIGGGTIIDMAKILSVTDEADVNKLYGKKLTKRHPLIAIPTTCGTGSEVTNIAVVNRTAMNTKQGLVSDAMYPDYAVLIDELIQTLPYNVFATSSIDALIHAIESYLSPTASVMTKSYSVHAMTAILNAYKLVKDNHHAYKELGSDLFEASLDAGIAFSVAGCGLVHAMSYAFGGKYHVAHGESNYQFLLPVLRFYRLSDPRRFAAFEDLLKQILNAKDGLDALSNLLNEIFIYRPMHDYGASQDDIDAFAQSTFAHQQRLLANAFVTVDEADIRGIYQECL